jgi:predicted phosphodiesterase
MIHGKSFHFRTAPQLSSQNPILNHSDCKLIIYGDDQTADFVPILAQITNHYHYQQHPEFIVHLGDINQNLGQDHENNAFFMTKKKLFRTIPYMPVIGNHDVKPITRFNAIYTLPPWYSFKHGEKIQIVCLSGYDGFIPHTNGQYEFLENIVQEATGENRFIVVCVHESIFAIEENIPEERPVLELRQYVFPLLKKYNRGFQRNILVFSGHMHEYCRILRENLTFFTVGACSNAKWYSQLNNNSNHHYHPEIVTKEYGRQSFAVITIQSGNLNVEIRGWGKIIIEKLDFKL